MPTVMCVHASSMPFSEVEGVFRAWVAVYLHQTGLNQTPENEERGLTELARAYNLHEARQHDSKHLWIGPDSALYESVLATTPDAHNVITIHVDLTMAYLEAMRGNILRIAYAPPRRDLFGLGDIDTTGPPPSLGKPPPGDCPNCGAQDHDGPCPAA